MLIDLAFLMRYSLLQSLLTESLGNVMYYLHNILLDLCFVIGIPIDDTNYMLMQNE